MHDVEAIETPDFGQELARRVAREHEAPLQRLLIGPPKGAELAQSAAFDRAHYGEIEQRRDSIQREVYGIIDAQASLMKQLGIPSGHSSNFTGRVSLEDLRQQLRQHADPWDLASAVVRTIFLGNVHNLIERAHDQGRAPYSVVSALRKNMVDRHELMHLMDEWDPQQRLYERFYSKLGNTTSQCRAALSYYFFHGEVNATIGELRYGLATMALDRLLSSTHAGHDSPLSNGDTDEHRRACVWVRDELLRLLVEDLLTLKRNKVLGRTGDVTKELVSDLKKRLPPTPPQ